MDVFFDGSQDTPLWRQHTRDHVQSATGRAKGNHMGILAILHHPNGHRPQHLVLSCKHIYRDVLVKCICLNKYVYWLTCYSIKQAVSLMVLLAWPKPKPLKLVGGGCFGFFSQISQVLFTYLSIYIGN